MKKRLTRFPGTFFQELRNTVEVFFELLSETLFMPNKPLHVLQSVTTTLPSANTFFRYGNNGFRSDRREELSLRWSKIEKDRMTLSLLCPTQ